MFPSYTSVYKIFTFNFSCIYLNIVYLVFYLVSYFLVEVFIWIFIESPGGCTDLTGMCFCLSPFPQDRVSLGNPGVLELRLDRLALNSASRVLGFKVCGTTAQPMLLSYTRWLE